MVRNLDVGQSALLTDLAMCINYYRLFSPGLYCCTHIPVDLDAHTQMTPDIMVMVNYGKHKQCDPGEYQRFSGAPNFVLDVFPEGDLGDYQERRDRYEHAGVIEYVAVEGRESLHWIWNRLSDESSPKRHYETIETSGSEIIASTALPGLWIPNDALQRRDWWTIMATIARGVTRKDHHDFMGAVWHPDRDPSDA